MAENKIEAYGMGVVILSPHRPGHILAIEERKAKPESGREIGQLSIPMETEVIYDGSPELKTDVTRAAMAEVMNDKDLEQVGDHFSLVRQGDLYVASESVPGIHFKTSVVRYDGDPDFQFTPLVGQEVADPHWVPVRDFFTPERGKVRPLASEVVVFSTVKGDLFRVRKPGRPLFPSGFSLEALQQRRDKHPDRIVRRNR